MPIRQTLLFLQLEQDLPEAVETSVESTASTTRRSGESAMVGNQG